MYISMIPTLNFRPILVEHNIKIPNTFNVRTLIVDKIR